MDYPDSRWNIVKYRADDPSAAHHPSHPRDKAKLVEGQREPNDPCLISLKIENTLAFSGSHIRPWILKLLQHLRMFGELKGINLSSTIMIRFAKAEQAVTALQAIHSPAFSSIANEGANTSYYDMPSNPDQVPHPSGSTRELELIRKVEDLQAHVRDLRRERMLRQTADSQASESLNALREQLSLAQSHADEEHKQSECYKTELENEITQSASLRRRVGEIELDLASRNQDYIEESDELKRTIDDMKTDLDARDLKLGDLEQRNKELEDLLGVKDRQLMASEGKRQMDVSKCCEMTCEIDQLRKSLLERDRQTEVLVAERDAMRLESEKWNREKNNFEARRKELEDKMARCDLKTAAKDSLVKVLHAKVDELKEKNKTCGATAVGLETRRLDLEAKLDVAMKVKEVAEKEVKTLRAKAVVTRKNLSMGFDETKKLSDEVRALRTQSRNKDIENSRLLVSIASLQSDLTTLQREREKESRHRNVWSDKKAIVRAQRCLEEFEETSFSRQRKPLTFEDVPWPVLTDVSTLGPRDITKKKISKFFAVAEESLGNERYWDMLERMYEAFKKQRWEKRGLLDSIADGQLCGELEHAREIIWAAVKPLWKD
ncbi:uncharacterized protein BT62DRAFT_931218 [Guyanagaster necrorhizus]|uniref:Uncharacterized protein n=1 Tax=Guyanagaster necrorhizus TaxID=856835 RepID=A0A9P8ATN0_9AGAR|nr:uncharacterized protein BT62DRAFT_931218 [Guyanagaster necrorhizus MCA 3950]KAG7447380.1 hypothetical protein BT62DRAFT_931218 [Guyanagaster necrorhizus MCA 3950]